MTVAEPARTAPPRRPRLDRYLAANIALWAFTYLLVSVRMLGGETPMPRMGEMSLRRAVMCVLAVGACALIQRALQATRGWPLARRLPLAGALAVAGGAAYTVMNWVVFYLVLPRAEWQSSGAELFWGHVMNFSVLVWSFIAWCAIVLAMGYDEEAREKTLRLAQAQALAAESQNQMLRYQINPHFLFNTLNALSALILQKDYARSEQMVLSLSRFLRASLERPPGDRTTLAAELEALGQYLAIEQIRFGERLRLEVAAPPDLADAVLPGLILQPLAENAVKHGVARSTAPVTLRVSATVRDGRLRVGVADDAAGDLDGDPPRLGVGLANVRRRLAALYGEAGRLTCGPRPGGGFEAVVELPLERR